MFINELVDEWVGVGPDGIRWSECFFNNNSKTEIFLLNKLIIDYFADYPLALVHVRASIETFEGRGGLEQPSWEHVALYVQWVEWGLGARSLRMVAPRSLFSLDVEVAQESGIAARHRRVAIVIPF